MNHLVSRFALSLFPGGCHYSRNCCTSSDPHQDISKHTFIYFGNLPSILSDISSNKHSSYLTYVLAIYVTCILTIYSASYLTFILTFSLAFYLAYFLTFYLACVLTFSPAYTLTFYLAKHIIRHSI